MGMEVWWSKLLSGCSGRGWVGVGASKLVAQLDDLCCLHLDFLFDHLYISQIQSTEKYSIVLCYSFSDHNTCHSFPPSLVAHTCGPPHSVLLQPLWICKTHRGCKKDCICLRRLVFFIVTCISCMSCLVLVYYQYGSSQYFCKLFDPSPCFSPHFLLTF